MRPFVHIFAGPSLPPSARPSLAWAVYHEPASQGDVYALIASRPRAIAIIDGYFERVPAVWHKEILWALSQDVPVLGASSMGALRAAELSDFGMIGVGKIFDDFSTGALRDDDEVTIVHGEASDDYRPGSEAMVNIRATLAAAGEQGIISSTSSERLIEHAKSLFYPDRSYPALLAWAAERLPGDESHALREWLLGKTNRRDVKREDARTLLSVLADLIGSPPHPLRVPWAFQHTDAWEQVRRTVSARRGTAARLSAPEAHALAGVESDAERHRTLGVQAALRALRARTARRDGFIPGEMEKQAVLTDLCRANGIDPLALESLPQQLGIGEAELERIVTDEACARHHARVHSPNEKLELLDLLRISGEYSPRGSGLP
jgi:hypothetical protein